MLRNRPVAEGGRAGKGCIVNVASLLGVHGGQGAAAYAASKAGVVGLTRALAAEMGAGGVRVNAILPGYVETDMTAGECAYLFPTSSPFGIYIGAPATVGVLSS